MEHKTLTLEYDKDLIDKILDDKDMRYIILFLYVIRYDLFKDLNEPDLIESYERILILDEIYKKNILNFWNEEFIEVAVDLGLFKNIRNIREYKHKDDDFIIKLGDETITIEEDTISIPDDTLYLMINKKFKFLQRRNFNLAITRLKGVRCEKTSAIHAFVLEIGEHDYTLSDDLYYILDQFGNIYQAIKIEITIEGFYQRFKEIQEKLNEFIKIFDPILNTKLVVKKINKALEENKDVLEFLREENVDLSDKFDLDKIDKENSSFKEWNSKLLSLINFRYQLEGIDKNLTDIRKFYSGKGKKFGYLEFIRKVSFNEDDILKIIQETLIKLRTDLVEIKNEISKLTKKELKLLNLDYERFITLSGDD
ncbi:MAG: hypothetical protein ACFE8L_02965 [Candidatus Hodarchaeota archaeon]